MKSIKERVMEKENTMTADLEEYEALAYELSAMIGIKLVEPFSRRRKKQAKVEQCLLSGNYKKLACLPFGDVLVTLLKIANGKNVALGKSERWVYGKEDYELLGKFFSLISSL